MSKNKAKDGIVVNAGNGNYIPNIVRGGAAIPIGKKNFYYMQGRKHEQGGIDVGRNPKTGLEVEGEEVMQATPNEVRVYSSVPFLRGVSPAELEVYDNVADKFNVRKTGENTAKYANAQNNNIAAMNTLGQNPTAAITAVSQIQSPRYACGGGKKVHKRKR